MSDAHEAAAALAGMAAEVARAAPKEPVKRTRRDSLERKVAEAKAKLARLEAALPPLEADALHGRRKRTPEQKAQKEKLVVEHRAKIAQQRHVHEKHAEALRLHIDAEEAKRKRKEAAAREAAEKVAAKPMTEEGVCLLVNIRLGMDNKFTNKVDHNENLWKVVAETCACNHL